MKTLCIAITVRIASPNLEKPNSQAKIVYLQVNQFTKKYQKNDKIIVNTKMKPHKFTGFFY